VAAVGFGLQQIRQIRGVRLLVGCRRFGAPRRGARLRTPLTGHTSRPRPGWSFGPHLLIHGHGSLLDGRRDHRMHPARGRRRPRGCRGLRGRPGIAHHGMGGRLGAIFPQDLVALANVESEESLRTPSAHRTGLVVFPHPALRR
jgi:hypothetical protein